MVMLVIVVIVLLLCMRLCYIDVVVLLTLSDHVEFFAQVRATRPHSARRRSTEDDHKPLVPRDSVYRRDGLPERGGTGKDNIIIMIMVIILFI